MFIRQENYKDHKAVYQLVTEAFATAEHADGNEQDLVVALTPSFQNYHWWPSTMEP